MLLDSDSEIPLLPYWEKIEVNFLGLRRKLVKKNAAALKLDISVIDSKEIPIQSPNSLNVSEN